MNIYFWGLLYGNRVKEKVGYENTSSYAIQKFNGNLVRLISKRFSVEVCSPIRTSNNIPHEERDQIFYRYLKYNGKIGRIILFLKSFFYALKQKNAVQVADALNLSMIMGIFLGRKVNGCRIILTVTDIPDAVLEHKGNLYEKIFLFLLDKADGYIFLTEQTNIDYNKKGKPYLLLEGIAKESDTQPHDYGEEKAVVYAGGLADKYNIKMMIEAFVQIAKVNERIYIFGDGECREYVKRMANLYSPLIQYMGTRENVEIMSYEKSADLLLNPRPNKGSYTKYSFPSKLIEYMTTGTPVVVNRLDGVPSEYYDYVYLFSGENLDGYKESLRRLLDLHKLEKRGMGKNAKRFILDRNGEQSKIEEVQSFLERFI